MSLAPLRMFFTLRHTTSSDVIARVFAPGDNEPSRERLGPWLDGYSEFGESPIKRPLEMTVAIHAQTPRAGVPPRVVRFRRRFGGHEALEVTGVHRVGDILFQDNDVSGWEPIEGAGEAWSGTELEGATLRLRAMYLSFDDINFRRPPRFQSLHLYFGEATPYVLSFSEHRLATPSILEDRAPLLHGTFFRTLVVEYTLPLTTALLPARRSRRGRKSGGSPSHAHPALSLREREEREGLRR